MRLSRTDLRMLVREELNRFKRSRLSEGRRGRSGRNLSESHYGDHSGFVFDDSTLDEGYVMFYYPDTRGMEYAEAQRELGQIIMNLERAFPEVSFMVEDDAEDKGYGISVGVPPIEAIKRYLSH